MNAKIVFYGSYLIKPGFLPQNFICNLLADDVNVRSNVQEAQHGKLF